MDSALLASPGLSLLEFQGYVACVLTQILRELEARSTGQILPGTLPRSTQEVGLLGTDFLEQMIYHDHQ